MGVFSALVGASKSLLTQLGTAIVYQRVISGLYNPADGKTTASQKTDYAIRAVVEGTGLVTQPSRSEGATLTEEGTLKITIAAAAIPFEPSNTDIVFVDGEPYGVTTFDPVRAGDDVVLYELRVKRGN